MRKNLPRTNPVFQAILNKARKANPRITERAVHYRITGFAKQSGIVSRRLATNVYAYSEMGINVQRILDPTELNELQEWLKARPQQVTQEIRPIKKTERKQQLSIGKKVVQTFGLPLNLSREAQRMADAYPDMYFYENLVRHTAMTILEKQHGKDWWNKPNVVSKQIKERVEGRKKLEGENRWHSRRGNHNIFYTNFGDLHNIISNNINHFKPVLGDLEIGADLRRLELSRNIIAHNNPLPPKEVLRTKMALEDLQKQLGIYAKETA